MFFVILLDANAKLGSTYSKNDPNEIASNGKIMLEMIERPELVVGNFLDI